MSRKLRIASACSADWERMVGDDHSRFCSQCNLHVYNLTEMGSEEIERLFLEKEGSFCGRMYQRQDGTLLAQDCPVGLRAKARRVRRTLAAALSAALTVGTAFAQRGFGKEPPSSTKPIQSEIEIVVIDISGAEIPGAVISLQSLAGEKLMDGKTDDSGTWKANGIAPGAYRMRISRTGFQTLSTEVRITSRHTTLRETLGIGVLMGAVVEVVDDAPAAPNQTLIHIDTLPLDGLAKRR